MLADMTVQSFGPSMITMVQAPEHDHQQSWLLGPTDECCLTPGLLHCCHWPGRHCTALTALHNTNRMQAFFHRMSTRQLQGLQRTGANLCGWCGRQVGHCKAAGVPLKRKYAEFRVTEDALLPVGTHVGAAHFVPGQYLDITGACSLKSQASKRLKARCLTTKGFPGLGVGCMSRVFTLDPVCTKCMMTGALGRIMSSG